MPHLQKLTQKEKIALIQGYLKKEISLSEACRIANVGDITIRRWIMQYEIDGDSAFSPGIQNRVYDPEVKRQAVEAYLSGEGSQEDICRKYKIRTMSLLDRWIKVYNTHGDFSSVKYSGGGSYMRQSRSTTQEERIQIAKDCIESGKNYGEIAQRYQVSYQQVHTWTKRYIELGEAGLEDRRGQRKKNQTPRTELERLQIENEELKRKLYLAEMENNLLKKLEEVERRDAFHK